MALRSLRSVGFFCTADFSVLKEKFGISRYIPVLVVFATLLMYSLPFLTAREILIYNKRVPTFASNEKLQS